MVERRCFGYHRYELDGIPSDFPSNATFFVLHDVFHSRYGSWVRYITFDGIRYALVLKYNTSVKLCLENDLLEQIYLCFDERTSMADFRTKIRTALSKGMTAFWSHLKDDYALRESRGDLMNPVGPLDFDRDEYHSLQLETTGTDVSCIAGSWKDKDAFQPMKNVYPKYLKYPRTNVPVIEQITQNVFKVSIDGDVYCLKAGRPDMNETMKKFSSSPNIPNVAEVIGLVVNSEDRIIGYLNPFVEGNTLAEVQEASDSQKEKWKRQLTCALKSLHDSNIVWGDAKPDNILVNRKDDSLMLIDFDGGCTDGWVDAHVRESKEGDLQAERRIHEFIDNL